LTSESLYLKAFLIVFNGAKPILARFWQDFSKIGV